jgi:hypothetical protein
MHQKEFVSICAALWNSDLACHDSATIENVAERIRLLNLHSHDGQNDDCLPYKFISHTSELSWNKFMCLILHEIHLISMTHSFHKEVTLNETSD